MADIHFGNFRFVELAANDNETLFLEVILLGGGLLSFKS